MLLITEMEDQMIADALKRIQTEGGSNNFVVFDGDSTRSYYIQFISENGSTDLYGEAVSNTFLPRKYHLTDEQSTQLQLLGWELQKGGNFSRSWSADNDNTRAAIAQEVMRAFAVYGVTSEDQIQVHFTLE